MSGPPVVKIGEEVVAHGDWLSKVKKKNQDVFYASTFITSLFQLSNWLSKVKKKELQFFFVLNCCYEFISAQRLHFFFASFFFQELIHVN